MKKAAAILAVLALAAFGLVACGDDDDDGGDETTAVETTVEETTGGGGGATALALSSPADGSFEYDKTELDATAGPVTIAYDNPASLQHDVVLESEDGSEIGKTDLISQSTDEFTAELQPGSYTFYCDVPGHREGGMEGTLTVK